MRIGYACLTVGVENANFRTCIAKRATSEHLEYLIRQNLDALLNILEYNLQNNIRLFRITSDLIPFGSSEINTLNWQEIFKDRFEEIGRFINQNGLRVSMHPGQYTVLNSNNPLVVKRAIEDLKYHCDVLDLMQLDSTHKIVLHIGGAYDNRSEAINRFEDSFLKLEKRIQNRLIIENDDKIYNIQEVLDISDRLQIPVVYDNLHNLINPYDTNISDSEWITICNRTWKECDGSQKVHYSQQNINKKSGSHSNTIYIEEFLRFYNQLKDSDLDIMLEVKDKNLSAVKCINTVSGRSINNLEAEWAKYKYSVLEKSQKQYQHIRNLLKDKSDYPAIEFYKTLEQTLYLQESIPAATNALQHVWGYFKFKADEKEKVTFTKLLNDYQVNEIPLSKIKKFLYNLAVKYNESYLTRSHYFYI